MPSSTSGAYQERLPAVPDWLNKGDNAWQMTAATLVGLQSMPGLVILYASIVKKKWAVNSAFMALYAFAAVLICWVLVGYRIAFGDELLPFWGEGALALEQKYLTRRAAVPESTHYYSNGTVETRMNRPYFPMATLVYFQYTFAAITTILLAGSVLGRMNIKAWMAFVPLWLIFCYTVGAYSLWGGGFLYHWGVIDYSGGYVIHLSSGISGFTAAYWVGPRLKADRERYVPNNILLMLAGAGLLWMGWSGFNGGAPYAANIVSSIAILNTNISAATSLLVWTSLDVFYFGKPSVIGAVQGMITGLACITPGAGVVQSWAAIVYGVLSGSIPWYSMMILHKKSTLLQKVDDTLAVFYTHAVAGILGGLLTGLFAHPTLCSMLLPVTNTRGAFYGGGILFVKQLVAALFIIGWNFVATSVILLVIRLLMPLRMPEDQLMIGDDAVHGEEAYALWGDGEKFDAAKHGWHNPADEMARPPGIFTGARGVTIDL
ncbi:ammonium transporter [Striga asiatica]|uniref:Ammonium transporter n=1 Tax=Striga asiatica TaxID=4170 RepID=A0A5A7PZ79_STRAF|nr:ammonium transporter [Striga asiatica]